MTFSLDIVYKITNKDKKINFFAKYNFRVCN